MNDSEDTTLLITSSVKRHRPSALRQFEYKRAIVRNKLRSPAQLGCKRLRMIILYMFYFLQSSNKKSFNCCSEDDKYLHCCQCFAQSEAYFKLSETSNGKINNYLKIIPALSNIRDHLEQIRQTIHKCKSSNQFFLIEKLSPIIRSWSYYYRKINTKNFLYYCDYITFKMLWRWACRRHPKKNKNWIKKKYFKSLNGKNWVFSYQRINSKYLSSNTINNKNEIFICLPTHSELNII